MQNILETLEVLDDLEYIKKSLSSEIESFYGKTVLILGGSGFLGSSLKKFLLHLNKSLSNPCKIISIDNYIKHGQALIEEENPNLIHFTHNIILPMEELLRDYPIDFIFNFSGNASPAVYQKYPNETIDVSIFGVRNALKLAHEKNAKIVNFSSSEVLGTQPDNNIPTPEDSFTMIKSLNYRASYDGSKFLIEFLSFLAFQDKIDCKVIRLFNCIGYMGKNDFRVIPNYFNKILNNQKIEVYKPGTQTRTFCFYTDVLVGIIKVLFNGKDLLYHIGNSDNEISMIDLANKVAMLCGRPELVELVPTPEVYLTEPKRRCPSIEKAKSELNYFPRVGLDEMLTKIHKWVKLTY